MSVPAHTGSYPRPPWHGLAVLALLVLSVVLATPTCEARNLLKAHDSGSCCVLHEPALIVSPSAMQASVKAGIALAPAAPVVAPPWLDMAAEYHAALPPPQAPPRSLPPYHARSARILA